MTQRIRLGLIVGGESPEHEISLLSAKSVLQALDPNSYEVMIIGIDKAGGWTHLPRQGWLQADEWPASIKLGLGEPLGLVPGGGPRALVYLKDTARALVCDVMLPMLHGIMAEDGVLQGLLKSLHLPFVGADVMGSAAGMDKTITKRLWEQAGLPIPRYRVFDRAKIQALPYSEISEGLGLPCFVKPANTGSSIGVNKVHNERDLQMAIHEALRYDHKIIIEQAIVGREIECAVLGNHEQLRASSLGEIIPSHEFYSYEAKYVDPAGARLVVPVVLPEDLTRRIQELAIQATGELGVEGMARVDFLVSKEGRVYLNELNTLPGFTSISMYPKLWEATGLGYSELLQTLIRLSLERHERDRVLYHHYRLLKCEAV